MYGAVSSPGPTAQQIADAIAAKSSRVFKGSQQVNSEQLASIVTLTVPSGTTRAYVQNNGNQPVRWTADGTDPQAMKGMRLSPGDPQLEYVGDPSVLRFIREQEGAILDINYYGAS